MKLNLVVAPGLQMTDNTVSFLGSIPDNPHEIPKFLSNSLRAASDTFLKFGTAKFSLRPMFAIGLHSKKELFPPSTFKDDQGNHYPAQDASKFNKQVVLSLNNDFPVPELLLLDGAFKTEAFKKHETHYYLQTQLRSVVDKAMIDHSIHGHRYKILQRKFDDPADLYQGSRAVANMVTCFQEHVARHAVDLDNECNRAMASLATATPTDFHAAVEFVEDHLALLGFAGFNEQASVRLAQIIRAVQHHSNYLISAVVRAPAPTTFRELRHRMEDLPHDTKSGISAGYFAAATAFFSHTPQPNAPLVHTQAYVDRLKRRLRHTEEIAKSHGATEKEFQMPHPQRSPPAPPPAPTARPWGRGGGTSGKAPRTGPVTAAAAVARPGTSVGPGAGTPVPNQIVEAFPAFVPDNVQSASFGTISPSTDADISPLPPELYPDADDFDWTSGAAVTGSPQVPLSPQTPPLSGSASASATSATGLPVPEVPRPAPPTDSPRASAAPARAPSRRPRSNMARFLEFAGMLILAGFGLFIVSRSDELAGDINNFFAFVHHNSWTYMALASSCVVVGITCLVLKGGRVKNRWMILNVGLAFVMAPTTAHVPLHDSVWELQTAGGPIPDLTALDHRASVMLAIHYLWCGDTGANRSIAGDLNDFVPGTLKPTDITITIAKAGITMKATAVGDCQLHTFDQHGKPCIILCKDVLYVPGAAKNLLSLTSLGMQGYQYVHTATDPRYPPGLHLPTLSVATPRYVPLQIINGLSYIATRNDLHDSGGRMLTRNNKYLQWHRNLGFMPMATLRKTKQFVLGLEHLADAFFPGDSYSDPVVKEAKQHHVDRPSSTQHRGTRPFEYIHWDTAGPMRTKSLRNCLFVTTFTCAFSGYTWAYEHTSTADIPRLLERLHADTSLLQEKHGPLRCVRRDNASVNVSAEVMAWLDKHQIRSETSNPYEPWQNGIAERMIQTLSATARTVLLSSGLEGRFWFLAIQYATHIHNLQFSASIDASPYFVMHGVKPDVSGDHQFGVEAWLFVRPEQRPDSKFSRRGEPCIFVGYALNQHGYLVWTPARNTVIATTNVIFGTKCPRAPTPVPGLFPDVTKELFLPMQPTAFSVEEVHAAPDLRFVGTCHDSYVLVSANLDGPRSLPISDVLELFHYTMEPTFAAAHLSLIDSYCLLGADLGPELGNIPRTCDQALSPVFENEWKPAVAREIEGFLKHNCFQPVPWMPQLRTLPGQWIFSRKRTGQPKARFVIGGHRQRLGTDYFEFKNYCAVLASRDNRILLALAAAHGWSIYQTDIEQAFLHGVLDDVDLFVRPPALYPCPPNHVLKLLKAVYGLHQAPPKFKKEVTDWLRLQGYNAANDSETVWILCKEDNVLIHALYADDFLHF